MQVTDIPVAVFHFLAISKDPYSGAVSELAIPQKQADKIPLCSSQENGP